MTMTMGASRAHLKLILQKVLLVWELSIHAEQALLFRRHGL